MAWLRADRTYDTFGAPPPWGFACPGVTHLKRAFLTPWIKYNTFALLRQQFFFKLNKVI